MDRQASVVLTQTVDGDGDSDAATCFKWVDFPPFCFPTSNSFLRFRSDLEIVSICLLFIEFFVSILGSSKMVHGWSFFFKGISVFFMLENLDLVQNLLVHRCDFRLPTAIKLRV